jgi:hypothetical protein
MMGLFGNKKTSATPELQIPDELAQKAALAYVSQQFARAFETYVEAVDKLHTMYVIGEQRFRQAGPRDHAILNGINNSLGAALAIDPTRPVDGSVHSAVAYLAQIAGVARSEQDRYNDAIEILERTLRVAR